MEEVSLLSWDRYNLAMMIILEIRIRIRFVIVDQARHHDINAGRESQCTDGRLGIKSEEDFICELYPGFILSKTATRGYTNTVHSYPEPSVDIESYC